MNFHLTFISLFFLLLTQSAIAEIAGKVKAVQFPSWIEREHQIIAIKPGINIEQGDVLKTGKQGKLLLSMDDGSDIKLGTESKIEIKVVKPATLKNNSIFGLALNVVKGVFRFTTSALAKSRKRDVAISFGTVTAGIRGTDIWGRVNTEKDLVCLIEGKIDVSHPQSALVRLDQPLQYYDAPKGEAGALKGKVEKQQLEQWAKLTELDNSKGIMTERGNWSVVLMSLKQKNYAEQFSTQLNGMGYPSEIIKAQINNEIFYRVIIRNFAHFIDAKGALKRLTTVNGVQNPWIKKFAF